MRALLLLLLLFTWWRTSSSGNAFQKVMDYIDKKQQVDPTTCSKRRLLVYHSYGNNFEGTGSILKSIMIGLAEAMHANRTLVWGAYVPPLLARGNFSSCFDPVQGGLYACFFKQLSPCALNDVWYREFVHLKMNGYDDTKRVVLQQARRGIAAYMAPRALRNISRIATIWPAALAAYAFRLTDTLADRQRSLAAELGMSGPALVTSDDDADYHVVANSGISTYHGPVHCAHVRHGDVLSMKNVYLNKVSEASWPFVSSAIPLPRTVCRQRGTV